MNDNESDGVPVNVARPVPLELLFQSSKLSLLLLHENDQQKSQTYVSSIVDVSNDDRDTFESGIAPVYNPFYSTDVNMRKHIEPGKFLPCQTSEEKKDNLVWTTCESGVNAYSSPITGNFTLVLASYEIIPHGEEASAPLYTTYLNHTDAPASPTIQAIPPTAEILLKGVQFLRGIKPMDPPNFNAEVKFLDPKLACSFEDVDKLCMQLSGIYLQEVSNLGPPYTTIGELESFIRERDWISDHVWGWCENEFLERIAGIKDEGTKWTVLRDYIYYNMAWVTKLLVLPVDSLHRTAAADCALRGIPPPEADIVLQKHVRKFGKTLTHLNGKLAANDGSQKNVIEIKIGLVCIVPTTIDLAFLAEMRDLSAELQEKGNHQICHNMVHMLRSILPAVSANLDNNYLMESLDNKHGLNRILRGLEAGGRREAFKTILVSDELCKNDDEAEAVADDLDEDADSRDWNTNPPLPSLSDSNLCEVYIILWIKKFSKVLLKTLKNYIKKHPNIHQIDVKVELKEVEHMSAKAFDRIFQVDTNKPKSATSVLPNESGCRLDIIKETVNKPILLYNRNGGCNVGKPNKSWDPVNNLHVKISDGTDGAMKKDFPHHFLDLVWLLMLSNLSQGCNKAIVNYLSGTANTSRFPQQSTDQSGKDKGRRSVRCLLLTISYLSKVIKMFHNKSVFVGEKNKQMIKAKIHHKLKVRMQELLSLMSAVENTCPLYAALGQNPAQPDWAKNPPEDVSTRISENSWIIGKHILGDYMCLLTVTFCMHMYRTTKTIVDMHDEAQRRMTEIVLDSLALDCNRNASELNDFADWTKNGMDDLQVTRNDAVVPDFPHLVGYPLYTMVQAARKTGDFDGTQRIDEFVRELSGEKAWTIIRKELRSADDSSADSSAVREPLLSGNPMQSGGEVGPTTAPPTAPPDSTPNSTPPVTAPQTVAATPTTTETKTSQQKKRKTRKTKPTDPYLKASKEWKEEVFPKYLAICADHEPRDDQIQDESFFRGAVPNEDLVDIALKSLVFTAQKVKEQKMKSLQGVQELMRMSEYDAELSDNSADEARGVGNELGENDKEDEESHSGYNQVASFVEEEAGVVGGDDDEEEEGDSANNNSYVFDNTFTSETDQSPFNPAWKEAYPDGDQPADELPAFTKRLKLRIRVKRKSSDEGSSTKSSRPSSMSSSSSTTSVRLPPINYQKTTPVKPKYAQKGLYNQPMNPSNNLTDTAEGDGGQTNEPTSLTNSETPANAFDMESDAVFLENVFQEYNTGMNVGLALSQFDENWASGLKPELSDVDTTENEHLV